MNNDSSRGANGRRPDSNQSRYSTLDELRFDHQIEQREAHVAGWRRNIRVLVLVLAAVVAVVVFRTFVFV